MIPYILPIVLAAVVIFLFRKRQSYYPFPTHSDYRYEMPLAEVVKMKHGGTLTLSQAPDQGYTVFAKVRVKSSLLGYILHPYITIRSRNGEQRQYVEYGTSGVRYINLSGASEVIKLKGKHLSIEEQEVEIYSYCNPDLEGKRILIVAPHPDDAEIAAYGLYAKYAENVFIMTISPGENGYFRYKELYSPDESTAQHLKKGELRVWNSLTVPLLAGVKSENLISFGYFNETLEEMHDAPDTEIASHKFGTTDVNIFRKFNTNPLARDLKDGSNWHALKENIAIVLRHFRPDIIVTPHPCIDAHEDHQYSTYALLEAARDIRYDHGSVFMYTNHFHYYPYGRTGANMPLPPCFDSNFPFGSVYSHPLSESEQRDKIFAFDAMNDLRPNTDYRSYRRHFARGITGLRARCLSIEKDYFNMYVRSNELFYILPLSDLVQPGGIEQLKSHPKKYY